MCGLGWAPILLNTLLQVSTLGFVFSRFLALALVLQSLFFSPGGHRTEVLVEYGEHGSIWEELWLVNLPDLDPSGFTLGCASDLTCLSPCRGRRGGTRPGCLTRCYFAPKTKEPSRVALPWWPTGRWRGRRRGRAPRGGELLQARAELWLLSAETSDQNLGQKVCFLGVFTVFATESLISLIQAAASAEHLDNS